MILLLGGTSETRVTAEALAHAGHDVLVSTATQIPLETGQHAHIESRHGRLDANQMSELIGKRSIRAVVDVAHPYATELHRTASNVAKTASIPYFRYRRPDTDEQRTRLVIHAPSHAEAARQAFAIGKPVLVTVGSKNVVAYAEESRRTGIPMVARVLDAIDSLRECERVGLRGEQVIAARGPFSVDENRQAIQRSSAGVLVSKESGAAGGLEEKLEAARLEHCVVVLVARPLEQAAEYFDTIEALVDAVETRLKEVSHERD